MRNVLIFGATSRIAEETARQLVARGCRLFLVGRNPAKLAAIAADLRTRASDPAHIHAQAADLDQLADHPTLIEAAVAALGTIDTVLIAHGTLPDQRACEASVERTLAEIHTNALSVISLSSLVANRFAAQGSGTLAVIGSVAGDRGRQSNYVYGSAKGMVDLFLQGLRNRLARQGVAVVTIKPGFVDTPMTAAFDKKGLLWAQPATVAAGIVAAIDSGREVVYLPWFWRYIMLIIRTIPERIFKRLSL
ncbi:SDR family oxidoreductase [Chitinimonas lacunae]|uniref:SDR family oxidoreductase n=1 Tax=Chitinimonas lacunae TaxID=1963018 RepID=A0ABV8MVL1_9NEIS